mmetsp:Transcript_28729/g.88042  ORF Transcript_28729/g.88042 Transcript_28729/m.88042 type:complete len:684 (-) Transcript_28729:1097-3148(-)
MFIIDWRYALGAWTLTLALLFLIVRTSTTTDWGSALHGLRFQFAVRSLQAIDIKAHLDENWTPQLLLLYQLKEEEKRLEEEVIALEKSQHHVPQNHVGICRSNVHDEKDASPPARHETSEAFSALGSTTTGSVHGGSVHSSCMGAVATKSVQSAVQPSAIAGHTHELMFSVAEQLRHGSGLVIAAAIVPGTSADALPAVRAAEAERSRMERLMAGMGVQGFCKTILAPTLLEGKLTAIQWAGLGPLTPNTLLMGWPWWWRSDPEKYVPELIATINAATIHEKSLLLCHNLSQFPSSYQVQEGYIDVWWIIRDGGLLLLIAHLLRKHRVWRKCHLRLHLIMEVGVDPKTVKHHMHLLLKRINIDAAVEEVLLVAEGSILPYMRTGLERSFEEEKRHRAEELNPKIHTQVEEIHDLALAASSHGPTPVPISRHASHAATASRLASRAMSRAPSRGALAAPGLDSDDDGSSEDGTPLPELSMAKSQRVPPLPGSFASLATSALGSTVATPEGGCRRPGSPDNPTSTGCSLLHPNSGIVAAPVTQAPEASRRHAAAPEWQAPPSPYEPVELHTIAVVGGSCPSSSGAPGCSAAVAPASRRPPPAEGRVRMAQSMPTLPSVAAAAAAAAAERAEREMRETLTRAGLIGTAARGLRDFAARHGLDAVALAELSKLFAASVDEHRHDAVA